MGRKESKRKSGEKEIENYEDIRIKRSQLERSQYREVYSVTTHQRARKIRLALS